LTYTKKSLISKSKEKVFIKGMAVIIAMKANAVNYESTKPVFFAIEKGIHTWKQILHGSA